MIVGNLCARHDDVREIFAKFAFFFVFFVEFILSHVKDTFLGAAG